MNGNSILFWVTLSWILSATEQLRVCKLRIYFIPRAPHTQYLFFNLPFNFHSIKRTSLPKRLRLMNHENRPSAKIVDGVRCDELCLCANVPPTCCTLDLAHVTRSGPLCVLWKCDGGFISDCSFVSRPFSLGTFLALALSLSHPGGGWRFIMTSLYAPSSIHGPLWRPCLQPRLLLCWDGSSSLSLERYDANPQQDAGISLSILGTHWVSSLGPSACCEWLLRKGLLG